MSEKEGTEANSVRRNGFVPVIDSSTSLMKVYVVSACTEGDFDAACDDPRSLIEGGMSEFAAPQLVGVASLPGLALEMGIHYVMKELREFEESEEQPSISGLSDLDQAKWVDVKDNPYDEMCPLKQDVYPEGWRKDLVGKPRGRPYYEVFLTDPNPIRTSAYSEPGTWACVVVQELILDKQEIDEDGQTDKS